MKAVICGTGSAIPRYRMDNFELSRKVDTSDEWIRERTGIIARHIAKEETTVSLAMEAAHRALSDAGVRPEEIELLLVSTISSNVILPCCACEVQKSIGAVNATCFDLSAACSGFVFAYNTAQVYLQTGVYKTALIIGSECLSGLTDWGDRSTCILFGDGAGAAVLKAEEGNAFLPVTHSDGNKGEALTCSSIYHNSQVKDSWMKMDGQAVFKFAVRRVPEVIREVLVKNRIYQEEVDWFILHQANRRIVEAVARHLREPLDKFPINLQEYGNTSSASIPILMDEMKKKGELRPGQKIILAGFGAGLSWCATLMEWK